MTESSPEILAPRPASVGGVTVARVLPRRTRRHVGPWCFVDVMGPSTLTPDHGLDVGPHPHIGLQTVTWLFEGAVRHRDSLGSDQIIRPGQLNLMTAGRGVSHAEETRDTHRGRLHGVQMWIAQPAATRDGLPAFEHHGDLPRISVEDAEVTVMIGSMLDATSPARRDTDHMGAEIRLGSRAVTVPLRPDFEHGLLVIDEGVTLDGRPLASTGLVILEPGRDEAVLHAPARTRVLVLGGEPWNDELVMWWNYVAADRGTIERAHEEWTARHPRFGSVPSTLPSVDVEGPPWDRPPGDAR